LRLGSRLPEGGDILAAEGEQAPRRLQWVVHTLLKRFEALDTQLHQYAAHASRSPSTDAPKLIREPLPGNHAVAIAMHPKLRHQAGKVTQQKNAI
jgi:hypothetical protein